MLYVTETPRYFEIQFDFMPRIKDEVKAIEGARWNPVGKLWLVPKNRRFEVEQLNKKYGAPVIKQRPEEYSDIPQMPEPSADIIQWAKENLKLMPYHYQLQGIERGVDFKRFINGDEPGLGKTLQSIATVTRLNAFPALIVCPSTLKENWRREWSEKFTNKKALVMTDKIKNTWQTYLKVGVADVMIVNYESLKKYFVASIDVPPGKKLQLKYVQFKEDINLFKSVVFDEIHKCKDITTQQAKFAKGLSKGKEVIIGLTGTPIVNGPKDLASQVGIINRFEVFGNYKNFQNRYCEGGNGAANLKELNYKMYSNFYFRRNKKDVLTDLPDRTRQVFLTDITTRREYDKAKNEFVKYLKEIKGCTDTDVKRKLKAQFIVQLGLLKAISARGKLDAVYEWVDEIISSGEKVILFCSLREIGNAVIQRYNKTCVAVRGDVTGDARQAAIDRFQKDDDIKVIVCSIKAAGTGLTLTASSRVGFIELPWHDADCDQCESRAHRIGQKNAVLAAYFLGDKTVDLYCYDIIKNKRKIAQTVSGQEEIDEHVIDNLINLFSGHD